MKRLLPLAALLATVLAASAAPRPNVVFIYADDWGWGDLSCHGHSFLQTPNLDRLAAQGTDFLQFNVLNPVCSPSRAAAMTGRYPSRFNINSVFGENGTESAGMPSWLDPKAPTVARTFHEAGYRTAHFGKWHLCAEVPDVPPMSAYGFDESAVYHGPPPKIPLHEIGDYAARFIEANKDHPFYVNVWLHESHLAHDPTPASMERWKHLDEQKQVYAAVITDGDNAVGKVLAALDHAGVAENTIVLFSSDNGPESTGGPNAKDKGSAGKYGSYYSIGETGGLRGRKRSLFEGGVRLPCLVRWPGHTPAGVKNDTTVFTAVDLLPTLAAAAGLTPPADARGDGENLLPALEGQQILRTRPIFWLHTGKDAEPDWWPRLAVREGDWKIVLADHNRAELHDLKNDRNETTDVAKDHPDVVAHLTQMALEWKATLPTGPAPDCLSQVGADPDRKAGRSAKKGAPKSTAAAAAKPAVPDSAPPAGPDRARAWANWDTNHDGILTFEEYQAGLQGKPNLEARFKRFDRNGDGVLTREEYLAGPEK